MRTLLKGQPIAYKGTITGLRISAVDGTTFIDGANASVTALADGEHMIEIYDNTGKMLRGWLGAVGTGETLGSELVTNGDMETGDPPTGWQSLYSSSISQVSDERTGGAGGSSIQVDGGTQSDKSRVEISIVTGGLYKISGWRKAVVGSCAILFDYIGSPALNVATTWNEQVLYNTSIRTDTRWVILYGSGAGSSVRFDDVSAMQVLTPSTAGATIVSTKSGATANFTYKNSAFAYNRSSYRVIIKKPR